VVVVIYGFPTEIEILEGCPNRGASDLSELYAYNNGRCAISFCGFFAKSSGWVTKGKIWDRPTVFIFVCYCTDLAYPVNCVGAAGVFSKSFLDTHAKR